MASAGIVNISDDFLGLGNLVGSFWTGQQIDANQETAQYQIDKQVEAQKEIAKKQQETLLYIGAGLLVVILIFIVLKYV